MRGVSAMRILSCASPWGDGRGGPTSRRSGPPRTAAKNPRGTRRLTCARLRAPAGPEGGGAEGTPPLSAGAALGGPARTPAATARRAALSGWGQERSAERRRRRQGPAPAGREAGRPLAGDGATK